MPAVSTSCPAISAPTPIFTAPLPAAWRSPVRRPRISRKSCASCGGLSTWRWTAGRAAPRRWYAGGCHPPRHHDPDRPPRFAQRHRRLAGCHCRGGGQSGLRAVLCYEVTDRNGKEGAQAGIQENLRFINRTRHERVGGRPVAATFGLHASLTLSDATLEACRSLRPEWVGFHIHVAEGEADEYDSLAKSGMRVRDRLHKHGILGSNSIVAHGVHMDAREAMLVAETGTWLTHQPRSNMNNGVGVASVESLLRLGIPVCLGTDGFYHAMWEEWKTAYLLQKAWHRDPRRMNGGGYHRDGRLQQRRPGGQVLPGGAHRRDPARRILPT